MKTKIENLKERVCSANLMLKQNGLITLTWGNVSAKDEESGLVVIKPSGVPYDIMCENDMVVVDLDGNIIEGKYRPSSDLPTHLYLYKHYPTVGGIVHTHTCDDLIEKYKLLGAKFCPADIGVSEECVETLLEYSPFVRNRLTLMRLRKCFV